MSLPELLFLYSLALFLVSILGGALPRRFEMTHTRTQLAMSLVSGLMLGVAFFHLLPHAIATLGEQGTTTAMAWVMLGLVTMLLLLRLLHFHHPDYANEAAHSCSDEGDGHSGHSRHSHKAHSAEQERALPLQSVSWKSVLIGLTFHTFIDGVALGAAFIAMPHGHSQQFLGFGVFLAILLHKPLDAMSITALMKSAGTSDRAQRRANLLFALVCPLGVLIFYVYALQLGDSGPTIVAAALAFSAGAFLCIALSDLLPEVQFHSHDRVKLTGIFLLGIAMSYLLATASLEHSHSVDSVREQSVSGG